ncbi:Predicted arabinose efflux permease, MFS family [Flavobacterium succinicans]|jgi:predicted MFS family arabinose efflux permease|uniref:Predicted arabinose efflux permease, MFS family n=1 Tax=Flavobacterium succinicans TaxID=29536 RepID=A0A1I4RSI6_9FLAO|nr:MULTISPECIES: MFS transporter [Flavobacterium]OOV28981.1 MFS transporter [Flavobacterium sp. LM5]SFM55176.1 Predicted arabinose efflux permease, MFS family [Flavobacterium succinicans]
MIKNYLNNFKNFPKEIWILTLITFINRAGTMVIPFLSKYMKENLEFSYSQIGWVMVFFGIGSIIGTWLSGKLSDKIGFYKVMVFSLFASGIIFILLHYAKTFEEMCVGILVLTTIADMFRPAMLVCLKTFTTKENRASAYSLTRAAVNLGFLFGPVLGGLIIMQSGYEFIFYADGATCILAIIVFVLFVKERQLPVRTVADGLKPQNISVMKDKPFMLHLVICLITGILFFQIFTTLPLYHKEQFNMSEFDSGLLLSLNGLLILLFELPIVNYVSRNKINNHRVIFIGLVLMATSFLFLLYQWEGMLIPMMLFMTCGVMLTFPFANSFAMDRAYEQREGKYMAAFTMSYSFAHILSAKTGMQIIQNSGYETNWIVMSILGVVGSLLVFKLFAMVEKEALSKATMIPVENDSHIQK